MIIKALRKNLIFLAGTLGHLPISALLVQRMKSRYPDFTRSETQVCIEGFPRSGNTFLYTAFHRWNRAAAVSHHTHLSSSVVEAVKKRIPTIVLIRHPEDAVASAIAWDGLLSVNFALLSYIIFYTVLWKYRHSFVVVEFGQAIDRTGDCIQALNMQFGSQFAVRVMDDEERSRIVNQIQKSDQTKRRSATNTTLPSDEKRALKENILPKLRQAWLYPMALKIYQQYRQLTLESSS